VAKMLKQLFLSTFRYYSGSLKSLKITLHKPTVAITATFLSTKRTVLNLMTGLISHLVLAFTISHGQHCPCIIIQYAKTGQMRWCAQSLC
jgi:hypothetical protein